MLLPPLDSKAERGLKCFEDIHARQDGESRLLQDARVLSQERTRYTIQMDRVRWEHGSRALAIVSLWLGLASSTVAWAENPATGVTPSAAPTSSTEQNPEDAADAESSRLFREGRRLLSEGSVEEACQRFHQSLTLERSPGTLLNVALCYERAGDFVAAIAHFEEALSLARSEPDERVREAWLEAASTNAARLRSHVGTVQLDPSLPENAVVLVNGQRLPPGRAEMLFNPGRHWIVIEVPGRPRASYPLELQPGAHATLTLPAERSNPETPSPAPPAHPSDASPSGGRNSEGSRLLEWSLVGGGSAAFGAALVMGAIVWHDQRQLDRECEAPGGDGERLCPASLEGTLHRARTLRTTADVVGLIGLASLGAGVSLMLANPTPESDSPRSASVRGFCTTVGCDLALTSEF